MANRLKGRVCVITGSGGSMGRAAARLFASEGGLVVGCDIHAAGADETVRLVKAEGGQMVSYHPCDLTDPRHCQALVDFAVAAYGGIDVLFNNAAMARFGAVDEMSIADWNANINEELNLVFLLTRVVWPHLKKKGGAIVNTASTSARLGYRVLPGLAHSAAKGAVLAMTRQLAIEGRRHGIRANSVSPGLIETNQTRP
ncbi:MAG TPA: SDR family NAD(P)-dependent oxidoreductase, partial [Pirellulales bacterium]|nr:SDR family NAD(P)-dependent oxidoreductase [Pirellulales bacterium]